MTGVDIISQWCTCLGDERTVKGDAFVTLQNDGSSQMWRMPQGSRYVRNLITTGFTLMNGPAE